MSLWFVLEASNRDVDIDADSVIMQLHLSWSFVTRVQPDRWETPRHFVVNKPPPPEMIRTQEREVLCLLILRRFRFTVFLYQTFFNQRIQSSDCLATFHTSQGLDFIAVK